MNDNIDDTTALRDALAIWLERRLHDTVGWARGSRLYGLTVLDADGVPAGDTGAVRVTFLADGWVYDLLDSPSARLAADFDAIGLCCFGKATHLQTLEQSRCRTVLVADTRGTSTVNRLRGREPELTGRPSGPVAERVDALFAPARAEPPHGDVA